MQLLMLLVVRPAPRSNDDLGWFTHHNCNQHSLLFNKT